MNPIRKELITLATVMPEPALWTGYVVLRTVTEIYDGAAAERDDPVGQPSRLSNVIDIRSGRMMVEHEPAAEPVCRTSGITKSAPTALADEARSRRIAEGQERLERLNRQISCAAAKGLPTEVAEQLFDTFLQSLKLMQGLDDTVASDRARVVSH